VREADEWARAYADLLLTALRTNNERNSDWLRAELKRLELLKSRAAPDDDWEERERALALELTSYFAWHSSNATWLPTFVGAILLMIQRVEKVADRQKKAIISLGKYLFQ